MSQTKWKIWFVVSFMWIMLHIFLFTISTDEQRITLIHNSLFMAGAWLSAINISFVLYVGNLKDDK
jgi:hypothetical protein